MIDDYSLGVLTAAKAMVMTVIDMLHEEAITGRKIAREYQPPLTKYDYLSLLRGMIKEETYTE